MAVANEMSTPRRGSFLETWRVFAGGARSAILVGLVLVGWMAFVGVAMPAGKDPVLFSVRMILVMLPLLTWYYERQLADRLSFMSLVPQPVATKWLVLAPCCAVALVVAAPVALFGRAPAVAALAILGCAWWMIGSTRWLHPIGLWAFVAWPVVALAPVAAYGTYRFGGWGPSAAVATVLGVVALLLQPRAYVGRPLPKPGATEEAQAVATARRPRQATSVTSGDRVSSAAIALRFFVISMESSPTFLVALFFMSALIGLFPATADKLVQPYFMIGIFGGSKLLGRAFVSETQEFLAAKPLPAWPRFIGGAVLPVLFILVPAVTAACLINRTLYDHSGALGYILRFSPPREDSVRYMREVLGATFLPDKWPKGGLPVELWLQLRPLLYVDLLRTALLMLTMVFAIAPFAGTHSRERSWPPLNVALTLAAFLACGRLMAFDARPFHGVPIPPLWFAALLAAVAIGDWARKARAVLTPRRSA